MSRRRGDGDWVPCEFYGSSVSVVSPAGGGISPLTGFLIVRHGMTSDLTQPPMNEPQVAVIEPSDDISLERLVGQMDVNRTDAAAQPVEVCARLVKVVYDEDNNQFASWEDDLFAADDANSPFLWQRYYNLASGASQGLLYGFLGVDMAWSHLDVRVGRLLERNEAMMMLLQGRNVGGSAASTVTFRPFLRSWCQYSH